MSTIIKKISVKTVVGEIDPAELPKGQKAIMRVVGIATGVKTGMSTYGEWVALRGNFSATNVETGEEFRSNVCFIPDTVTDMVAAQLADDSVKAVDFAIDVTVAKAKTATGYEYNVNPLMDVGKADPLEALMASLPKLEAPKEEKKAAKK